MSRVVVTVTDPRLYASLVTVLPDEESESLHAQIGMLAAGMSAARVLDEDKRKFALDEASILAGVIRRCGVTVEVEDD